MSLFALSETGRDWMVSAVAAAAQSLGMLTLLTQVESGEVAASQARDAEAIAKALHLSPARLRPLVDVLAAVGALVRRDGRFAVGAWPLLEAPPPHGWGRLAEVVRRDKPLPDDEALDRFHAHLRVAGAAAAERLATLLASLPTASLGLVDLGGGAGIYSEAFAALLPASPVTLVDRANVLELAAPFLNGRATLVAGDLLNAATPAGANHGIALLSNVLHLYSEAKCLQLIARAAACVVGGGWVVVKDLAVAADRAGPIESLLFAVNMALYTEGGDVHDGGRIAGWFAAAGLTEITVDEFGGEQVVRGRRVVS